MSLEVVNTSQLVEEEDFNLDYYFKEKQSNIVTLKFTKHKFPDHCPQKSLEVHKLSQGECYILASIFILTPHFNPYYTEGFQSYLHCLRLQSGVWIDTPLCDRKYLSLIT